jgi:hypothetical protein
MSEVKIANKPLMSKWQGIMLAGGGEVDDPLLNASLHAMFMTGAGAVLGILSKAKEAEADSIVEQMVGELKTWADILKLAYIPEGTKQ